MKFLIEDSSLDIAERVELIVSYLLQFVILVTAFVYGFYYEEWGNALLILGILFLTLLPAIIRRSTRVHLPVEFDVITIVFIFFTLYLGDLHSYYTYFWWWDVVLHTTSGFLFGIGGFVLIFVLNQEKKIHLNLKPIFVAVFGFVFALALGAMWEMLEFGLDASLGIQWQPSLEDTMWDLIVDTIGAGVIATLGYFYMKKGDFFVFDRMIHKFVEKNPRLFRGRKRGKV